MRCLYYDIPARGVGGEGNIHGPEYKIPFLLLPPLSYDFDQKTSHRLTFPSLLPTASQCVVLT